MPSVAIIGASPKPDRVSHQATVRYRDMGWTVIPINPAGAEVAGLSALRSLDEVKTRVDIVCLYVNPDIGRTLVPTITALKPTLVWFNPGTEDAAMRTDLEAAGIKTIEACTLVVQAQGDPLQLGLRPR